MVRRRAAEWSPGRAERTRSQRVDLGVGPRPVVRGASAVKRRGDEVPLAAPPILLLGTGRVPSQVVY
jgi:hypothetical protein